MLVEILGWSGSAMVVGAFGLTTLSHSRHLQICNYLNLLGSILVGYNCYMNAAFPSLVLNLFWLMISVSGVIRTYKTEIK